jgi:GH24 family phage-related lysozyme (muramidase)
MKATAQLVDFLKTREGFKPFSSPCPSGEVYKDGPFEGTLIHDIGYGCRYWEDGKEVVPDEEINSYEAELLMVHRIENEFEPAVKRLFPTRQFSPGEWDALVSRTYNFGEKRSRGHPIVKAINDGKSGEALARQWVKYCNPENPSIRHGVYRSRVAEMLMWFGLPYKRGFTCAYREDVWDIINEVRASLGIPQVPKAADVPAPAPIKVEPEPVLILDKPLPMEAKVPRQMTLPDEWDKMTEKQQVAWLNTGEFIALGGKVGEPIKPAPLPEAAKKPASVVLTKKVIETPNLKADAPAKPMETSTTARGLVKVVSGKEIAATGAGAAAVLTYTIPYATQIGTFFDKFPAETIIKAFGVLFGLMFLYGVWRAIIGSKIMQYGRDTAEEPKV